MVYVKRDSEGNIVAVSRESGEGFSEQVEENSPDVLGFLFSAKRPEMFRSDLQFVRVLEDLITVLIDKGVMRFTDLPEASQTRMLERQHARVDLSDSLDLIDEDAESSSLV